MASCGLPPLGRFLGSAFLQFAFISGGPLKAFTPRIKQEPTISKWFARTANRRRRGTDHSRQASQVQWLFVSPPVLQVP